MKNFCPALIRESYTGVCTSLFEFGAVSLIAALGLTFAPSSLAEETGLPVVRVETNLGDLFITLTPDTAPVTVANFREYVTNGDYVDTFFHVSQPAAPGLPGFIGTGEFMWPEGSAVSDAFERAPIANEFNQSNSRGTVSMLKDSGDPDSATNGWFINTADNGGSAPDGFDFVDGGFSVFGTLNARSLALADEIAALRIEDRGDDFESLPVIGVPPVLIQREDVVLITGTRETVTIVDPIAAVLPGSRTVPVGITATAFATILNTASVEASSCTISPPPGVAAAFAYQQTEPTTNQPIGPLNPLIDIAANGAATFIFAFTPEETFATTDLALDFNCGNANNSAISVSGVNTFTLSAPPGLSSDVVAIAGTVGNTGINDIPSSIGSGAFVIATTNLGDPESIVATADDGDADLPIEFFICPTNPTTGSCQSDPASSVTQMMATNATATFAVFAQLTDSNAMIALDPANSRAFVRFSNAGGDLRGSTSVALQTVQE